MCKQEQAIIILPWADQQFDYLIKSNLQSRRQEAMKMCWGQINQLTQVSVVTAGRCCIMRTQVPAYLSISNTYSLLTARQTLTCVPKKYIELMQCYFTQSQIHNANNYDHYTDGEKTHHLEGTTWEWQVKICQVHIYIYTYTVCICCACEVECLCMAGHACMQLCVLRICLCLCTSTFMWL